MIIKIGKAKDNDFIANDPHVSRHHARLIREDGGNLLLEDTGSTNGTFVNGAQIVKKRVTPTDHIRLGDSYVLNLSEVLKYNNDYSDEFAALKKVYDDYIQAKVKIQSSNQFKTRLFQSLPFALPGIVGVVIGFLGKGSPELFGISLLITICAPTVGIYLGAKQSAKIPQQLQDIANQFKIDYVCPKCGTFLGEIPWESLKNRKQCPVSSCKAKWELSLRDRSIVTVVALMAQGLTDSSFRYHLTTARNNGVTKTEIAEILTHAAFYAGWPKAWAAFRMAKEVWAEDNAADAKAKHQNEMVFPIGAPNDAFAKYFIGQSYLAPLSTQQVGIYNVTFEPGCRNNWHIHHAKNGGGQILICVAGRGYYQEWGKPAQELRPGDVVNIPVGVKHWHGAAPDSWFSHLAVEVPGDETSNEWLEAVDNTAYFKATGKEV